MRYQQRRRPDVTKDVVQLRPAPAALLRGVGSRRATEIYGLTLWVIIARFPGSLHGFESTLLSQLRGSPRPNRLQINTRVSGRAIRVSVRPKTSVGRPYGGRSACNSKLGRRQAHSTECGFVSDALQRHDTQSNGTHLLIDNPASSCTNPHISVVCARKAQVVLRTQNARRGLRLKTRKKRWEEATSASCAWRCATSCGPPATRTPLE